MFIYIGEVEWSLSVGRFYSFCLETMFQTTPQKRCPHWMLLGWKGAQSSLLPAPFYHVILKSSPLPLSFCILPFHLTLTLTSSSLIHSVSAPSSNLSVPTPSPISQALHHCWPSHLHSLSLPLLTSLLASPYLSPCSHASSPTMADGLKRRTQHPRREMREGEEKTSRGGKSGLRGGKLENVKSEWQGKSYNLVGKLRIDMEYGIHFQSAHKHTHKHTQL